MVLGFEGCLLRHGATQTIQSGHDVVQQVAWSAKVVMSSIGCGMLSCVHDEMIGIAFRQSACIRMG
jgi:hypothetical protein